MPELKPRQAITLMAVLCAGLWFVMISHEVEHWSVYAGWAAWGFGLALEWGCFVYLYVVLRRSS